MVKITAVMMTSYQSNKPGPHKVPYNPVRGLHGGGMLPYPHKLLLKNLRKAIADHVEHKEMLHTQILL
jgi:hypothetical protein